MYEKIGKAKSRVLIALKEVMNIITNLLVPFVAILVFIAELLPIPFTVVKALKTLEYILFNAYGTAKDIEKKVEEIKTE